MSSSSRVLIVAASVGAVEALKDQGFCRWNYVLRSLHQHAKNNIGSFSQLSSSSNRVLTSSSPTTSLSSSSSSSSSCAVPVMMKNSRDEKLKQSEESLRKVMYLSCWGPN